MLRKGHRQVNTCQVHYHFMHKGRGRDETVRVSIPRISGKQLHYAAVPYHISVIILHRCLARFSLNDFLTLLSPHDNIQSMSSCPVRSNGSVPTIISMESRTCIIFWRDILSQNKLSKRRHSTTLKFISRTIAHHSSLSCRACW